MTPEGIIKNQILDYLRRVPACVIFPITMQGLKGRRSTMRLGTPDIICSIQGRFVGIEVKTKTGKPSVEQKEVLRDLNLCASIGFIARSVEDVIKILKLENLV